MTHARNDLYSSPGTDTYRAATTPHNATIIQRPAAVAIPAAPTTSPKPCGGPPSTTCASPYRPADTARERQSGPTNC